MDENGKRIDSRVFDSDMVLKAVFKKPSENGGSSSPSGNNVSGNTVSGNSNTASITITADNETFTMTYTDRIIYDGRKHMTSVYGKSTANNAKKAYDLKLSITDKDGKAIDPTLIKVSTKKNKNAGTGQYRVKIKGKKYKALNKLLNSTQYKEAFKFTIDKRSLDSKDLKVELNKKGTKVRKVLLKDSDGNLHKLKKKDFKVDSLDAAANTTTISGSRNTDGKAQVKFS